MNEEPIIINNFKDVYVEPAQELPPNMEEYDVIQNYQIYRSNFNKNIYTIHDHENELYHVIEDVGSDDIDFDLEQNAIIRLDLKS